MISSITGRLIVSLMCVAWVSCAAVQFNDPDGWVWMLLYGYVAAVTGLALFIKTLWPSLLGTAAYLAGFVYWMPGWNREVFELMWELHIASARIEALREALGLLLCGLWMLALTTTRIGWKNRRAESSLENKP
jgi:hypothetical protein